MWFACGEGGLSRMLGSDGAPDAATHWRNWGNHNDLSEPYPWAGNEPMYSVFEDTGGIFWMGGNGVGRWILPRVNLPAFGIGRTLTSILLATMLSPNAQARHGWARVARAFTGSTASTGIT